MAATLSFVDKTPAKNEVFAPADNVASPVAGLPAAPLTEEPDTFFGKVSYRLDRLRAYKEERFSTLKPWSEFADRTKFSVPGKLEGFSRVNKNVAYFYSNYVIVAFFGSLYVLITNPSFTISMGMATAVYYYLKMKVNANEPIILFGREVAIYQAYTSLIAFALISFYFTGGSSTVFWLVLCALGSVLTHALLREPQQDNSTFSFSVV